MQRSFGSSAIRQSLVVAPGQPGIDITTSIDWHEQEHLLKLAFPVDVHTDRAAYETQYGHHYRPTHENTSWDSARFEVCAHRWVQLGEPGFGVGLANDSTYGHDVSRHPVAGGGSYSIVRQSLIRGPRFPDPRTDQDEHTCAPGCWSATGSGAAIEAGYDLNLPERRQPGAAEVPALVAVTGDGVVLEAVKLADDRSGDLIVRLYESRGGRSAATLSCTAVSGPGRARPTCWSARCPPPPTGRRPSPGPPTGRSSWLCDRSRSSRCGSSAEVLRLRGTRICSSAILPT